MSYLANKECTPCRGGVPALTSEGIEPFLQHIQGWQVIKDHHLHGGFEFPDFQTALDFVNQVGHLAEEQGHHPDMYLSWGKVVITIWTHKIDGLTESDFILAAKINRLQCDSP